MINQSKTIYNKIKMVQIFIAIKNTHFLNNLDKNKLNQACEHLTK